MWAEPYNSLHVWGSCFHQIRTPFTQCGALVQQGLSAAYEVSRLGGHRGAADKRYSLGSSLAYFRGERDLRLNDRAAKTRYCFKQDSYEHLGKDRETGQGDSG